MIIANESGLLLNAAMVSMGILMIATVLAIIRLIKGPTLADRVMILDLIASLVIGFVILYTLITSQVIYLAAAIMVALIAFMGTVAFAKYLNKRYSDD
jgi:multicomponent Na+:H+ antiporter subunit F